MKIRLAADLQPDSIVDGEGIRTVGVDSRVST